LEKVVVIIALLVKDREVDGAKGNEKEKQDYYCHLVKHVKLGPDDLFACLLNLVVLLIQRACSHVLVDQVFRKNL
jgi:hypothetical protein